jgi:DNA-3-methyladenine glycosylase
MDWEDPIAVARELIGWELRVNQSGGVIVETEAYRPDDPACHAYRGQTARNAALFGPPGRLYVYRSYGIHWCVNVVCMAEGVGAGVLIRALEPTVGVELMIERRGINDPGRLCRGPGNVGKALGAGPELNGVAADLRAPEVPRKVRAGTRIGLSVATERLWRFGDPASPALSRPLR